MPHPPHELLEAYTRYVALRGRAEAGEVGWEALAEHFSEDAWFSDPAWGRVEGRRAIAIFMAESMAGLEGWTFPRRSTAVDGDRLIAVWGNRLPGRRPDGSFFEATGVSIMSYAGDGRWASEEDILNMTHVIELIRESGWTPGAGFTPPPVDPPR